MATGEKFPWIDYVKERVSGAMFLDTNLHPMWFVLCIRDMELKNELTKFIEFCGGGVCDSLQNMDPYAAVLVSDSCLSWAYHGDVFKLSYIESCFKEKQCLDISDFRRNVESNLKPGFNYMDVIYFKKYPWSEIPLEFLLNTSKSTPKEEPSRMVEKSESFIIQKEKKEKKPDPVDTPEHMPDKHTRMSYTMTEKTAILKYIVENEEFDRIKGNQIWKIMEKNKICKYRTWQSMKEHFMKKIMVELSLYKFLTPDDLKKLKYNYVK